MKTLMAVIAAVFAVSLAGCNTMAGAGKDMQRGGEKIEDAAYKVRSDWRAARDRHEREYETSRITPETRAVTGIWRARSRRP